jgi:signal transduction histidine kinase
MTISSFSLQPRPPDGELAEVSAGDDFGSALLLQNAWWFTRIRWAVIAVLAGFGLTCNVWPKVLVALGMVVPRAWPWIPVTILTAANLLFLLWLRSISRSSPSRRSLTATLWVQIALDLSVLTFIVHCAGSTSTFAPFAYLFHISLACIFFRSGSSFLVTLLAALMYLGCVAAEIPGWIQRRSLFGAAQSITPEVAQQVFFAFSAVFVWLVVWHLTSSLSSTVRRRDRQLADANEKLVQADQEKNLLVLRTTHDLKEPFSGIEASIQLLKTQHWNELPDSVQQVIDRIRLRSESLRERIKDILMLGELRSRSDRPSGFAGMDLRQVLEGVVNELAERSAQRGVAVDFECPSIPVRSQARQLHILFANLLTNAIIYAKPGDGRVRVSATASRPVRVQVEDNGIGIDAAALPHIFDEYFRTAEAVRINKMSTGLGLAIVRQVAQNLGLGISVQSEPGKGTRFDVTFPASSADQDSTERKAIATRTASTDSRTS